MATLDDIYGEAAVNEGLKKQKEKVIASGQGSLFFDEFKRPDINPNYENMKKEAVKKADAKQKVKGGGGKAGANPMKTGTLSPFNMKKGGKISSASKRADGIAIKGFTRAK